MLQFHVLKWSVGITNLGPLGRNHFRYL